MATKRQKEAARKNIKKAQARWREMSPREHSRAQPEGRARAKPGTKGEGAITVLSYVPRKDLLPSGTMMLDGPDTSRDLLERGRVDRGLIRMAH